MSWPQATFCHPDRVYLWDNDHVDHAAAATDRTPERQRVSSAANAPLRPCARQRLGLLDYRWSRRQAIGRPCALQQLLGSGHALSERPLTYPGTPPPHADLPDLAGLYVQHVDTRQDGHENREGGWRAAPEAQAAEAQAPEPTLEDSVIEGLIQALYAALPDALGHNEAEATPSGNKLGRHGYAPGIKPDDHWLPVSVPPQAVEAASEPEDLDLEALRPEPAPDPEPRPYMLGSVPEGVPLVTLRSLAGLEVQSLADPSAGLIRDRTVLGSGEACFLRAQAALWSWRIQRQTNMDIHVHGPPTPGRDALIEQKIGPVTLLLGYRVTDMSEEVRRWGFTLSSLAGQVLVGREAFLVEWQEDDAVVFQVTMQQQLAMPNLTFLGPVHSALRRKFKQGYIRNMLEQTAD